MIEAITYLERLREIALDQHGFVTAAQALEEGIARPELAKLVSRERIDHVAHGVYRIPQVPATEYDNFMLAVLWTGAPEACLSHDTALAIRELSDINPNSIHITVAENRRIKRRGGEGYTLHHEDLEPQQICWLDGIPIVDVRTAISQCIKSGVPSYLIRQAIEQAGKTSELCSSTQMQLLTMMEERNAE
jgi:predicted transcriptional regulator of viral defense system